MRRARWRVAYSRWWGSAWGSSRRSTHRRRADELDVPTTAAGSSATDDSARTYLVMMRGDPALTYAGGTAANPGHAARLRREDRHRRHDGAQLPRLSPGAPQHRHSAPGPIRPASCTTTRCRQRLRHPDDRRPGGDDVRRPAWLGGRGRSAPSRHDLDARLPRAHRTGGAWEQGHVGDNVVIGVVDSGIWPESDSFCERRQARQDSNPAMPCKGRSRTRRPPSGTASARRASGSSASTATTSSSVPATSTRARRRRGHQGGLPLRVPVATRRRRSRHAHGQHSRRQPGVQAVVDGAADRRRQRHGAAGRSPPTRSAGAEGDDGGCNTSDSVAAIDQAVADGVDVINYSISGSTTSFLDPVEVAFFNAAAAGVFVAASAGNNGPGASTVAHNSPWITTVAASTHDRTSDATLTLGTARPTPEPRSRRPAPPCSAGLRRGRTRRRRRPRRRGTVLPRFDRSRRRRRGDGGLRSWRQRARREEPCHSRAGGLAMVLANTSSTRSTPTSTTCRRSTSTR